MARHLLSSCLKLSFTRMAADNFQVVSCRYSQFGPQFIDPYFRKENIQALRETGEDKKVAHIPIKAAKSGQTSSEFYDAEVEKFINYVMRDGRKELARQLVNKSLEMVKRLQVQRYHRETDPEERSKIELNAVKVFHDAVSNCKPLMQLTPIKRGGATYQVPVPVNPNRSRFMAMNWLIEQGKSEPKTERFPIKLARELIAASQGQGKTIRRKEELHKQCEANRAYAHYRWG